jgi:hypothetical protein
VLPPSAIMAIDDRLRLSPRNQAWMAHIRVIGSRDFRLLPT